MTDADRIAAIVRKAEDSCCTVTVDEIRWLADRAADRRPPADGCPGCAGALAGLVDTICAPCRAAVVEALARPLTVGARPKVKWVNKDSVPPSTPCATCGHPASPHSYRHPFAVLDANPNDRGEMP